MKTHLTLIACGLVAITAGAADTAAGLAARLSTLQQDGSSFVKLRLEVQQPPGTKKIALQLQIKQRRTSAGTDVLYQVLWPKERMGEAVLLRQAGGSSTFTPPSTLRPVTAAEMREPLFGSDLAYADVLENFFAWENQTIVGTEIVDRVSCQVLESKPGKGQRSIYASVRSWVDTRRLVPLRVEKYSAPGQLARRIDTTRVATDDKDRHVPATLVVRGPQQGSITEMEGTRLKHGVVFSERDFSPEGIKETTPPRSAPD